MKNSYSKTSLHKITYYPLLSYPKTTLYLLFNQITCSKTRLQSVANWWGQLHLHLLTRPHIPDGKEVNFNPLFLPVCNGLKPVFLLLHPP